MKLENGIFEGTYRTSFSQCGIKDVLTNKSFLSLMENLAGAHSAYCHFTFKDLAKDNLSWIILSWKLQVLKRPKADEKITIKTWGRSHNRLFIMRDFRIYNSKDELLAIATSKWCLIDTIKNKIAPLPNNIEEIYKGFVDDSVFGIDDMPRLTCPTSEPIDVDTYKIRRFDIDINKHVHNLNYLNFAYELLPFDVFVGDELNNFEITYRHEIKYGETIKSYLYKEDDEYTIIIKSEDDKVIHAIVKLY